MALLFTISKDKSVLEMAKAAKRVVAKDVPVKIREHPHLVSTVPDPLVIPFPA